MDYNLSSIKNRILIFVCIVVIPVFSDAMPSFFSFPVTLTDKISQQPIIYMVDVLEDPKQNLTLETVASEHYAAKFTRVKADSLNLDYSTSVWWVHFTLNMQSKDLWYLLIDQAMTGNIDLFIQSHNAKLNTNTASPLFNSLKRYRVPAWKLNLPLGETFSIYIRANNGRGLLYLPIKLMDAEHFIDYTRHQYMFFMMVFSGLWVLTIYNLFLFYYLKESSYFSLAIVIVALQLIFLSDSHLLPCLSFLNNTYSSFYPISFFVFMGASAHYWRFISQRNNRYLEWVLMSIQWGALILFPAINYFSNTSEWIYQVLSFLLPIVMLLIIHTALAGHKATQKALIPTLIFTVCIWFYVAARSGYYPQHLRSSVYLFQIGSLVTFMLLSINQINYSRQLREQTLQIAAVSKAKETFLTTMSHELRTPMNAVIGISTLIGMTPLNTEQKDYISKLKTSSRYMLRLIDNILDFSKIEQGGLDIAQTRFNLDDIVNDIRNILYTQACQKNLSLVFDCHYSNGGEAIGDATRLSQVLLNIVGNAIKFTEKGRVDLVIHEQALTSQHLTLYFEIKDTGIGISSEQLLHLFQPFAQINTDAQKCYSGSGLGLVISQRIIEKMGGKLALESKLGEGCRFFFTLNFDRPILKPHSLIDSSRDLSQITLGIPIQRIHLLLVDDDKIGCFVAHRFLQARHIQVTLASSGEEALSILCQSASLAFSMIFMDVSLPKMDGYETTRKIRALGYKSIPIIALTAHAIMGERERCIAAGMNDFFTKPFKLQELEEIVRKWA